VLYQNGAEAERYLLDDPGRVADLLNRFYDFAEPDIEGFEAAVTGFQERRHFSVTSVEEGKLTDSSL